MATDLSGGDRFNPRFLHSSVVKELLKLVYFCQSCVKNEWHIFDRHDIAVSDTQLVECDIIHCAC